MLPPEKIDAELEYLMIAISKTAGLREEEAWGWLTEKVEVFRRGDTSAARKSLTACARRRSAKCLERLHALASHHDGDDGDGETDKSAWHDDGGNHCERCLHRIYSQGVGFGWQAFMSST